MGRYRLTGAADADLVAIARDTVARWGVPQMEVYLRALAAAFERAAAFPGSGRPVPVRDGYFRTESGSHSIFYVREDGGVLIVRVLHRRMEPRRHLGEGKGS